MRELTPELDVRRALVTGAAGFIGFNLCRRLLADGWSVTGIDNLNEYYDIRLKQARLEILESTMGFDFRRIDISNDAALSELFTDTKPPIVVNLAAQAGVRFSIDHPSEYIQSNLVGFANILEACRHSQVQHLLYASSSSVYGANKETPFKTSMNVDHPISLYAATKKSNELMAHSYSHLYDLPVTGVRFFTVYGPWGRPDMAYYLFTKAILNGEPIRVFNEGELYRDFTYIDDAVECLVRLINRIPDVNPSWDGRNPDPSSSSSRFRVYNIGNSNPVKLSDFIEVLEKALGVEALKDKVAMQPGDMEFTSADIGNLRSLIDYAPATPIEEGLKHFVAWYREFHAAN